MVSRPLQKTAFSATGYRVLLIEDNSLLLTALTDGLRLMGHDVNATLKGADAARLMELLEPDVVVSDIVMPEVDMLDTFTKLKAINAGVKIIAISANPHLLMMAGRQGVRNVLAKPFELKKLDSTIRMAASG
jgi:DNA-binding NtrC family response regulator